MKRRIRIRKVGILCVLIAIIAACGGPGVEIQEHGNRCFVDVSFLGEYPSDVRKFQVRDGDQVVWEIVAGDEGGQFHWLWLQVGENDATFTDVYHGTYNTKIPKDSSTFSLDNGIDYEILVWDKWGWASRCKCRFTGASINEAT